MSPKSRQAVALESTAQGFDKSEPGEFRSELMQSLPLPLAHLYGQIDDAKTPRDRHDNAYYWFEALVKLTVAPLAAAYLCDVGRDPASAAKSVDDALGHLARPSVGHWVQLLRHLAAYFSQRSDNPPHPLSQLRRQLEAKRAKLPGLLALYREIKSLLDDATNKERCSLMDLFNVLPDYRNGAIGHTNIKPSSFYRKMLPLFLGAANDVLGPHENSEDEYHLFGPMGTRLVYLAKLKVAEAEHYQIEMRELVSSRPARLPAIKVRKIDALQLVERHVAILWPDRDVPLSLAPFLRLRRVRPNVDLSFLNGGLDGPQAQYLSYMFAEKSCEVALASVPEHLLAVVKDRWRGGAATTAAESQATIDSTLDTTGTQTMPAGAPPLPDYQRLGRLGRGGMGVVELAWQQSLERWVALKTLPLSATRRRRDLGRFRREMRHLARCQHPNIVKVLQEVATPDRKLCYAIEYIPGCNLRQVWRELRADDQSAGAGTMDGGLWTAAVHSAACKQLKRAKQWRPESHGGVAAQTDTPSATRDATQRAPAEPSAAPEPGADAPPWPPEPERPDDTPDLQGYQRRVAALGRDVARALQAVHERGIVHRDVKPENLMMTADASRVVLMDFGVAKGLDQKTRSGLLQGTLPYAAPEQLARGTRRVGPQADVHGLGVVLWELLARRRLFAEAEGDEDRLAAVVQEEDAPRLRTIDASIHPDLEAIVEHAVKRNVKDRIQTAAQLGEYLRRYLEQKPIDIRPRPRWERARDWIAENTLLVGAAAAIALVAVVAFAVVWNAWGAADQLAKDKEKLADERQAALDGAQAALKREETALTLATREKRHAQAEERRAERQERVALQNSYVARIRSAQSLWEKGEVPTAWHLLNALAVDAQPTAPAGPTATTVATAPEASLPTAAESNVELGWEWHYLAGLCRSRLRVVESATDGRVEHVAFHPSGGSFFSSDSDGNIVEWDCARGSALRSIPGAKRKMVGFGFGLRWHEGKLTVVNTNPYKPIDADKNLPQPGDEIVALSDSEGRMVPVAELDQAQVAAMIAGPAGSELKLDVQPREPGPLAHFSVVSKEVDSIGNASALTSIAVSPDGTMLATSGVDKTLRIWLLDGYLFPTLLYAGTLAEPMSSIAFSPDSRQFAGAYQSNVAIGSLPREQGGDLWGNTGWANEERHTDTVTQVLFVPNHPWLLSAGKDGTVKVWYREEEILRQTLRVIPVDELSAQNGIGQIATDGERLAVVSGSGQLQCWDLNEGRLIDTFAAKTGSLGVAFRPHDFLLAAARFDGTIGLLDRQGKEVRQLPMCYGPVFDVAISPDGQLVAACGLDRSITLRPLAERGADERTVPGSATRVALTPDGRRLITAGGDRTIRVRDGASGRLLQSHKDLADFFYLWPDGARLVSARGDQVVAVDLATGEQEVCFRVPTGKVASLAISPAQRLIAAVNDDAEAPKIVVYDNLKLREACRLTPSGQSNSTWLAFSLDGKILAHRSTNHDVDLWSLDRQQRTVLKEQPSHPHFGAFQPMTNDLAIGCSDGAVSFWSIKDSEGALDLQPRRRVPAHRAFVTAIDFTDDGRRMATAGADGMVRCWDSETGQELLCLRPETGMPLSCVAFGGVGKHERLMSGNDRQIQLWDAAVLAMNAVPQDPEGCLLRGCVRSDLEMWQEAAEEFSDAIRLGVDDPYVWQYRGMSFAQVHRFDEADDDFAEAAKRIPNDPSVHLARHLALAAAGNVERAEEEYERAVKLVGNALLTPGDQRWGQIKNDWEAAEFFGWDRVIAHLTRDIERGDAPWYVYRARAAAFMDLRKSSDAAQDFLTAKQLKPDDWQTLRDLARAHLQRKPKPSETNRDTFEQARDACSQAIALDPSPWELWYLRALACRLLHEFERATDDCTEAIERHRDGWALWAERGAARAELGQFELAAADLAQAIELGAGDDNDVWNWLVHAERGCGDDVAYHQTCLALLRRHGATDDPEVANTIAWDWAIGPHSGVVPDDVVAVARRAVAAKRESYARVNTLGCALYRAGEDLEAFERLNEAVVLHGKGGAVEDWIFLALVEARRGHADAARGWYDKAADWLAAPADETAPFPTNREQLTWTRRVECQVLLAEIEQQLKISPAPSSP